LVIRSYAISIKASTDSVFVKISKKIDSPIILYVDKDDINQTYMVIIHTNLLEIGTVLNFLQKINMNEKTKILTVKEYRISRDRYALALKEKCEFYGILEEYNVRLMVPYVIRNGMRKFCIYGDKYNVEKYIENLKNYYGKSYVEIKQMPFPVCVDNVIKLTSKNYLFSQFTPREYQILESAYNMGYVTQPRRAGGLEKFAGVINASKPTASIMLKKAIKKILGRLFNE
jgi:predicted DNA binding protein